RTRLHDLDDVANLGGVLLVVRLVLHATSHELVEAAIAHAADHGDDRGLVHLRGRDRAENRAAATALVLFSLRAHAFALALRVVFFAGAASAAGASADFCACFSEPCARPLRIVRMRAMSRRFVVSAAEEVTWLVYWPSWRRKSSSRVVASCA